MSQGNAENRRYQQHLACLSALTPKYLSLSDLHQLFEALKNPVLSSSDRLLRFHNLSLLDSDGYRSEVLYNVDKILEKYDGDFLSPTTSGQASNAKVEKDLLWAGLQLFAHIQAIEQEVGLILDPKTEYAKSLKKLQICQSLLRKNGSDTLKIDALLNHAPVVADVESGQWYESAFKAFIRYIDSRNDTRLFWVWGRPNLDLALEYAGQAEARSRLADTTYIPGQISWSLYLFRGSFFAIAMFNKWWNNPKWLKQLQESGLSAEEYAEYRLRYLLAYWNVYKYRILNDYVWGPINFGSFEWWVGTDFLEGVGNFATCFLLCMDIYLADLAYVEEESKYQTTQALYTKKQDDLTALIVKKIHNGVKKSLLAQEMNFDGLDIKEKVKVLREYLGKKVQDKLVLTADESKLSELLTDLDEAQQDQQDHTQRWRKKEVYLRGDCYYTKALLFVFAMAVSFLIGGFLPTALALFLTKTGTIWCLLLTVIYRTVRAQVQISQVQSDRAELIAREENLLKEFLTVKQNQTQNPDEKNIKRLHDLYLLVVKTGEQINYQSSSIQYQYLELARTSLLRVSIPTLLGLTLVYAPATLCMVPTYVFVLIASAAFAYVLDRMAKQYKPAELEHKPCIEHAKYQTFFAAPKPLSKPIDEGMFCFPSRFAMGTSAAH